MHDLIFEKIEDPDYPCVGAKSAAATGHLQIINIRDIRCPGDDAKIFSQITEFIQRMKQEPDALQSLIVVSAANPAFTERAFETALWTRLQALTDLDCDKGWAPDPSICSDPKDANFGMSFAGHAFYIIGLHPGSSRPARRFPSPAIVFNSRRQFTALRERGVFKTMSEKIMARDALYSGSKNPMFGVHGEISEARQYSGRSVSKNWTCPFLRAPYETDH